MDSSPQAVSTSLSACMWFSITDLLLFALRLTASSSMKYTPSVSSSRERFGSRFFYSLLVQSCTSLNRWSSNAYTNALADLQRALRDHRFARTLQRLASGRADFTRKPAQIHRASFPLLSFAKALLRFRRTQSTLRRNSLRHRSCTPMQVRSPSFDAFFRSSIFTRRPIPGSSGYALPVQCDGVFWCSDARGGRFSGPPQVLQRSPLVTDTTRRYLVRARTQGQACTVIGDAGRP